MCGMPFVPHLPLRLSVRDMVAASRCQWQFAHFVEYLLTRPDASAPFDWHPDVLALRIGELGASWETTVLENYWADARLGTPTVAGIHPQTVLDMQGRPRQFHAEAVYRGLSSGTQVFHDVYVSHDANFSGIIPFLVKTDTGFMVQMPKFGSHVHPETLVYLGFYVLLAHRLLGRGPIECAVSLSSGRTLHYDAVAQANGAEKVMKTVIDLIERRLGDGKMLSWRDTRGVCGKCWFCQQAITANNDVLAVSGVGTRTRDLLKDLGVYTVSDLAALTVSDLPETVDAAVLRQAQAQDVQLRMRAQRNQPTFVYSRLLPHVKGPGRARGGPGLGPAGPGDVYLDFEIDNLRRGSTTDKYGLVYLTGLVGIDLALPEGDAEGGTADCLPGCPASAASADGTAPTPSTASPASIPNTPTTTATPAHDTTPTPPAPPAPTTPPTPTPLIGVHPVWQRTKTVPLNNVGDFAHALGMTYVPLWAHSFDDEKRMFDRLMRLLLQRKETYPDMRIYHYSHHEPVLLKRLAKRHGMFEGELENLMGSGGVFFDLFNAVKHTVITGQSGYSLKDLEPLYCGAVQRNKGLSSADETIVVYNRLREALMIAALRKDTDYGVSKLSRELAQYNEYDCCSMVLLRSWLEQTITRRAAQPARRRGRFG